jgi:hypothetical protein
MKVIRAFNILTGDVDYTKEKGYCSSLYDGIECCCIRSDSSIIEPKTSPNDSSPITPIKTTTTATSTTKNIENDICDDTCTCATNITDCLNACCNQPNNQHYMHNHVNDNLNKNHHNHEHSHHHHHHHHDHHNHNHDEKTCSSPPPTATCTSPRTCKHTIDTNKYKFHSNEQHLHLKTDKKFIADLIIRAEPEIQGR